MEFEVAVPSAHAFVQRCHRTWTGARETLLRVGACTKAKADRHRSKPPVYVVGQKVWLSTKNIPLRSVCNKLAPKFIGPFPVTKIISPVTVCLKLPPAYRRIHPAFHETFGLTLIRLLRFLPRHDSEMGNLPIRSIGFWTRGGGDEDFNTWCTGKVTVRRREVGFRPGTYWITPLLMITINR